MTNPYAAHQRRALETDKNQNVEAWALLELARRLDGLKKTPDDKKEIMRIVRMNWQVWTVFQSALLEEDNPLPIEIRTNLLNLANFIDKRSIDVLARPAVEKIDILIHINRNIGSGLMGERGEGLNPEQMPENMEGQPAGPQLETEESKKLREAQIASAQAPANQGATSNQNQNQIGQAGKTSLEV